MHWGYRMRNSLQKYLTCVGVTYGNEVYVPKHREIDGRKHYSAGICTGCVELVRKLRISKELSSNGLEKELLDIFVCDLKDYPVPITKTRADHKGELPLYGNPPTMEKR